MKYNPTENKDYKSFSDDYQPQEKEILILTSDASGGAGKLNDSWDSSQHFLAYVDLDSQEFYKGEGRVNWLLTEEECEELGTEYPYNFEKGTIYHLKVRELIDKNVPEGRLPSFYNRFMVIEVLHQDVKNEALQEVLTEYRKPVIITDATLGKFELNKDYSTFEGNIVWKDKDVSVSLEVEVDNKKTWTETLEMLRKLYSEQNKYDKEFRDFAAKELTELANDWAEEDVEEIKEESFSKRISLSELTVNFEGEYTAYYSDDDLFYGHVIMVSGNMTDGPESADIAG